MLPVTALVLQGFDGKPVWQQLVDVCERNPSNAVWRKRLQAIKGQVQSERDQQASAEAAVGVSA